MQDSTFKMFMNNLSKFILRSDVKKVLGNQLIGLMNRFIREYQKLDYSLDHNLISNDVKTVYSNMGPSFNKLLKDATLKKLTEKIKNANTAGEILMFYYLSYLYLFILRDVPMGLVRTRKPVLGVTRIRKEVKMQSDFIILNLENNPDYSKIEKEQGYFKEVMRRLASLGSTII